jgi:hypothetical protein
MAIGSAGPIGRSASAPTSAVRSEDFTAAARISTNINFELRMVKGNPKHMPEAEARPIG